MKKSFVLITRSYKYGGYCVAGFDTETKRWIRLVSSADPANNEIPKSLVEPFDDLDILEVEVAGAAPYGCQFENFVLDPTVPPRKVGKFSFYELLSLAYVSTAPTLFGNFFSGLSEEEIARQRSSLGLFYVRSLFFDYYLGDDGKRHYRSKFLYRGRQYSEISVTDPVYRRDGFAGETIEHALLAVSLPALPYPNGKYCKFIAKIFPLSAEEAERFVTSPSVSAPRPRTFARDFPDATGESIPRAVRFLQALAEGRDPDTDAVLDPALILSPSYAAWLRYCAKTVAKISQDGESGKTDPKTTYLLRENIEKIELSDDPITASRFSERVNAVREPYGKKLTAVAVGNFFLEAGMLCEEGTVRKRKLPTELGRSYGIGTEQRVTGEGVRYLIVLYGRAAQQFFVDNIDQCAEVLDAPLSASAGTERSDSAWTKEDETMLKARFEEGAGVADLVRELGRTPNFIRKQLSALGLNEGAEERDRSWGHWDEQEQAALLQEFSSGLHLEEIAKLHKRSVVAITARLKMLNIKV